MDFGMVRAERRSDVLYMRSAGTAPYVHVTHQGEPAFLGFAFSVGSRADLDSLAASPGFTPVEAIDAPGGGWKTSTVDTVGHVVEAVFGFEPVTPLSDLSPRPLNMGETFQRIGATQRIKSGPSRIKRFGHLAMNVPDPVAALAWYHARFGLIASDRVNLAPGMPVAIFTRCDKGAEPADHHSILFASNTPNSPLRMVMTTTSIRVKGMGCDFEFWFLECAVITTSYWISCEIPLSRLHLLRCKMH